MDDWTDGNFTPGDDAPGPYAADDATATSSTPGGAAGDDLPGVPVPGYPELRAGVPGGDGALGLYRVDNDYTSNGAGGSPQLQTVSWRDTDPEANRYDLYTAKRDLGEAQAIGNILGWGGGAQTGAAAAAKATAKRGFGGLAKSLGGLAEPYTGMAGFALGQYMNMIETPRLQNKINTLQARQQQFSRRT